MINDADLHAQDMGAAAEGLASDYWWRDCSLATQKQARDWVRAELLEGADASDLECDRLIASLSPGKREALIRRAVNGWPGVNF